MTEKKLINPAVMVTHIGGLDSAADSTLRLPEAPAGKKLIYTSINMALTAIDDFEELGKENPHYARLAQITKTNKGLWCAEAEKYLLKNWHLK